MAAVWIRFRAELRTRWKAWLVLAVLAGIAGGLVIAAAAGARRTDSVVDRHAAAYRIPDTAVIFPAAWSGAETPDYARIAGLPQVSESSFGISYIYFPRTSSGKPFRSAEVQFHASVDGRYGFSQFGPKLLEGRLPDLNRPNEAYADKEALEALGVRLGETVAIRFAIRESWTEAGQRGGLEAESFIGGDPETTVRTRLVEVRIVGVRAKPWPPEYGQIVLLTPAFYREYGRDLAVDGGVLGVDLEHGAADIPAFQAAAAGEDVPSDGPFSDVFPLDLQAGLDAVHGSIHLQAQALWLVAAIGAVSALALLGLALARQAAFEAVDGATLRALGMTARQLVAIGTARAALVGLAAAAVSILVAAAFSALLPLGRARELEPDPGVGLDPVAVGVGAAAVLLATCLVGLLAAWRATRVRGRRPAPEVGAPPARARAAELLARHGFPATIVAGVRLALAPGRGASAVPVRTTIAGAVLAVAVLGLALTFTSSLAHLFDTPRLYGKNWDYETGLFAFGDIESRVAAVRADPAIEAAALGVGGVDSALFLEGRRFDAAAFDDIKGSLPPTVIEGRAPRAADEILLGSKTMDALGLELGDTLEVRASERTARMEIVGRGVQVSSRLGDGAEVTLMAYRQLVPDPAQRCECFVRFRIAPGRDHEAVLARLERTYLGGRPVLPAEVADFGGVEKLPFAVAALFAAVTAAVLAHTLVTSIRRRRRDLAVLKTLGFDRGQVLATVAWQATTVAAIGLLIGLPIGIGLGRWAWNLFAEDLGVVPEPVTPLWPVLLAVPATILLANLVAAWPGRMAALTQPALVLRAE